MSKRKKVERHGDYGTRLWTIYNSMKQRCSNRNTPFYKNYGGRGIAVCDEWKNSYLAFRAWALANGYSDKLTIDRKDGNGGYTPTNCRWADHTTQIINSRIRKDNTSGFKGVSLRRDTGKFFAYVTLHGKRKGLGSHHTLGMQSQRVIFILQKIIYHTV